MLKVPVTTFLPLATYIDALLVSCREQDLTSCQREAEENKQYLVKLVDVTKTLAKCGLAFRAHDERVSSFTEVTSARLLNL